MRRVKANLGTHEVKQVSKVVTYEPEKPSFRSIEEEIAGSRIYERNKTVEQLKNKWPHLPRMWSVDKWFPYSKIGPLCTEEPRFNHTIEEAKQKQQVLIEAGIRCLVLKPGYTRQDLFEQMSELEQCLGSQQSKN